MSIPYSLNGSMENSWETDFGIRLLAGWITGSVEVETIRKDIYNDHSVP